MRIGKSISLSSEELTPSKISVCFTSEQNSRLVESHTIASHFHKLLTKEVSEPHPFLRNEERALLQEHYPTLLAPMRYPPELVETIYANRRAHVVRTIMEERNAVVFDAGCGYGSESFLFASLGARVLSVDISEEKIRIAEKRQRFYEEIIGKPFDITFAVADLDEYTPNIPNLSTTWLASVLAAVRNQDEFLTKVYQATRPGGQVMITDMNLLNPLFLIREWRRRQQAKNEGFEFALHSDFWGMVKRQGRIGARYFPENNGRPFDDVQFFSTKTLSKLLSNVGFTPRSAWFSGFVPPHLWQLGVGSLENLLSRLPLLRWFGYFYLVAGIKR
jgi:SAM-dependent methyltransferase